jgi:hypothetical protein
VPSVPETGDRGVAVECVPRAMLNGVAGPNLIRRQRIALIAGQAFNIGRHWARDPANAVLVPHLEEVKRLKSAGQERSAVRRERGGMGGREANAHRA